MSSAPSIFDGARIVGDLSMPVVEITPDVAREWLKKNKRNRNLRMSKVDAYATAMKNGQWRSTREPIEFGENGDLVNGQHRLEAVVKSGVTIENPVKGNVPASEIPVIDTGLSRTAGDVLGLSGHKHATQLAASAKMLWLWRNTPSMTMLRAGTKKLNNEMIKRFVESEPELIESVDFAKKATNAFRLLPPSAVATIHYEIWQKFDRHKADEFFKAVTYGINLTEGSPILALRNVLMKSTTSLSKPPTELRMAWTIHAFNKWARGEDNVRLIKHVSKSEFPNIIQMFDTMKS